MDFIAGVDGGGTKTKVVCASPEGKVLDLSLIHISEPTRPY